MIRCDRIEDAFLAFQSSHAGSEEGGIASLRTQFDLLHAQIRHEKEMATTFVELFSRPSLRKRCAVGFLTCFAGQATATQVIASKFPLTRLLVPCTRSHSHRLRTHVVCKFGIQPDPATLSTSGLDHNLPLR